MKPLTALRQKRFDLHSEGLKIAERIEAMTATPEEEARAAEIVTQLADYDRKIADMEALKAMEMKDEMPATMPAQLRQEPEKFKSLGEQLQAVARASGPGAFMDNRLAPLAAAHGMNEGVSSQGGFLVQQDLAAGILTPMVEQGKILRRCQRIPISANANGIKINAVDQSSRADGYRWGGVNAYWAAEAGTVSASKPKLRQMTLDLKKLMALYYATDEVLADAAALTGLASQAFQQEMLYKAEDAVIRGTGAGQPKGILSDSGVYVEVSKESNQAADTVVFENIVKMYARMWPGGMSNAVWFVNQDVLPQLFSMSLDVGTGGVPVFLPPGGASASPYGTLMGRPIEVIEQADTVGDLGDIMFLDLSQYLLAEKGGVEAASSIHVYFAYDETTFRFIWRLDGQPAWNSYVTPANSTSYISPFIVLEAR